MLKSLFQRRVPQIVGLYIGATWMMIEIGDWVTDRFQLAPDLTSYIFVGMVALLPAVAVVAWYHGAPGKDEWTRIEKTVIPVNLLLAVFAVIYFVGPLQQVSATEIRQVVDETGQVQVFEVPKAGFNRKVTVFFFQNRTGDAGLDWLSFGLPVMLAHDLNHHTPLISAATPFHSRYLREDLRNRGFAESHDAPRPLLIQLARARLSDTLVIGNVDRKDNGLLVTISLINAETGAEIAEFSDIGDDWMRLVDRLSLRAREAMELADRDEGETDPISENLSGSIKAVRKYIEAQRAAMLDNDYPLAMAALGEAVIEDPTFAEAYSLLGTVQYLNGASQDASATIDSALAHDYRLSQASKFRLRSLRYQFAGKIEAAIRVLQMWTEVQPENPEAFKQLGELLLVQGTRKEEALAAFRRVLELNPSAYDSYLQQALVEQTRGDFEAAGSLVTKFLEYRADDVDAHILRARILLAAGQTDEARGSYRDAEILAVDELAPALGLARLDIRLGNFDAAKQRVDSLLASELSPAQKVEVLNVVFELQYVEGRLTETLATLKTMDDVAQAFLPPVLRIIQIGSAVTISKTMLGDFDGARAELADMAAQVQPPFDSYLAFSRLSIEAETNDRDAFMAALADAEGFYAATNNEVLAPFLFWGRAYAAWLDGDNVAASTNVAEAQRVFDASFIKTLSEPVTAIESKVEMFRLQIKLGELDAAEKGLQKIIDSAPALATVRLPMARLLHERGDNGAAKEHLDVALAIWANADEEYLRFKEAKELSEAL